MTHEELVREIFKDYDIVIRKAVHLMQGLRRKALKSKDKHVHKIFDYKSMQQNNWLIFVDYLVKDPTFIVVVYYLDIAGFNAIMVTSDQRSLVHYSSHFLERYNERFLKHESINKLDLLKRFLYQNPIIQTKRVSETDEYKNRFFGRLKEGIGLGYFEVVSIHSIYFCKTFISNDMIFESQQRVFDLTSFEYKLYWNEAYKKRNMDAF